LNTFSKEIPDYPVPQINAEPLDKITNKWDAHPIKLTGAALRAHRISGDDLFLKAAGGVQNFFRSKEFWDLLNLRSPTNGALQVIKSPGNSLSQIDSTASPFLEILIYVHFNLEHGY
jgi:hypothetical protein